MLKIAVFVSGRGSNLKAVLDRIAVDHLDAEVSAVISNKINCPALEYSETLEIDTIAVSDVDKPGYYSYDVVIDRLKELQIDLIILAGFLKKIPDRLIDLFNNKIINIHPALLPSFGGKGMYGMNVHKAVFESSAKVSGATVHFVNKVYDDGKIIAQRCVDISDVKSPEEIAERVLKIEHELLPSVVEKFVNNKVRVVDNRVEIN